MTSQLRVDIIDGNLTSRISGETTILVILSSEIRQQSSVLKYIESKIDLGCKEIVFAGNDSQKYLCFVEEELLEKVISKSITMLSLPTEEIQEITSLLHVSLLSQKLVNEGHIVIEVLGQIDLSIIERDLRKSIEIIS